MFRLLEDGGDFGLLFPDHASCNNRLKLTIIAVNTRWKPERDPEAVVGALRAPPSNELLPRARKSRGMCSRY
jgi:hypothetical protein